MSFTGGKGEYDVVWSFWGGVMKYCVCWEGHTVLGYWKEERVRCMFRPPSYFKTTRKFIVNNSVR